MLYLTKILQSSIPFVAMTAWIEPEMDNPELKSRSALHDYPALPGKLAKRIVGELPVVSAEMTLPDPLGRVKATWQLRPAGRVWGVGLKVPVAMASRIPERIEQSFPALQAVFSAPPQSPAPKR
jgi:hypothetical protein